MNASVYSPALYLSIVSSLTFVHLVIVRWIVNSRNLPAQSKCREFYDLSVGYIHIPPFLPFLFL